MRYRIRREGDNLPPSAPTTQHGWAQDTLRDVLLEAYQEQRRARLWRNIWRGVAVLLFLAVLVSLRSCGSSGGEPTTLAKGRHTAVINLNGTIGDAYTDQVAMLRDSLERAYANKSVKGIIIRANSPGGSPVVSNIAFNEIRRIKAAHQNIPLYVVAEDMCASGCYYIAAAADKIYADPSSIVGSIGVIGGGFDFTGLMDKLGIKRRLKTAGSNKGMGDPFTPETPEQQAIWTEMLDDIHQEFIKSVKLGRGNRINETQTPDIFSGRIYTGNEAKKVGLIDDYGNVYSVARDVIKAPELVDYTPEDPLSSLLGRRLRAEVEAKVQETLDKNW
ncbi:S49 family peptidase [Uruburuella testudinis]|uniref:S49 family peptidase n=1 Tax=Uruburuella testudinis TaxID=1282863 RepID=A0ABY4DUW0_9NEIS|nr:S49 family peptidase [Uruburuella testudinis]UOO82243.1 S49 family peptidase [Uruburuella testudinis]